MNRNKAILPCGLALLTLVYSLLSTREDSGPGKNGHEHAPDPKERPKRLNQTAANPHRKSASISASEEHRTSTPRWVPPEFTAKTVRPDRLARLEGGPMLALDNRNSPWLVPGQCLLGGAQSDRIAYFSEFVDTSQSADDIQSEQMRSGTLWVAPNVGHGEISLVRASIAEAKSFAAYYGKDLEPPDVYLHNNVEELRKHLRRCQCALVLRWGHTYRSVRCAHRGNHEHSARVCAPHSEPVRIRTSCLAPRRICSAVRWRIHTE